MEYLYMYTKGERVIPRSPWKDILERLFVEYYFVDCRIYRIKNYNKYNNKIISQDVKVKNYKIDLKKHPVNRARQCSVSTLKFWVNFRFFTSFNGRCWSYRHNTF